MQKEILTREKILIDLKKDIHLNLVSMIFIYPLLSAFTVALFGFISFSFTGSQRVAIAVAFVLTAIILALYIYEWIFIFIAKKQMKNLSFKISQDWVVDKLPKIYQTRVSVGRPYTLVFAKSGKYAIHGGLNYHWSEMFSMDEKCVYESTDIDDDFYVISVGKRKNVLAYNKKKFELEEQEADK